MGYDAIPADLNLLSNKIIGLAIKVHSKLGPGLLESTYKECLCYEINKEGLKVSKEKPLPLVYESVKLDLGFRVDLIIEDKLIVEIKAIEALADIHTAQILTYLKLSECRLGFLMNFNVLLFKKGIKRFVR